MKHKTYSIAKAFLTGTCLLTIIASCKKDFFEIEDPNGVEDAVMWTNPGSIGLFLNRTYNLVMPQWPTLGGIHNTSDEMNNGNTDFLYGRLTESSVADIGNSTGITANRYSDIRRCNVAIEGINGSATLSESDRNTLKGQFFFLRAYTYFKLVRLYGGVPLILKSQNMGDENLQVPRAKTGDCIAAIAADLDSAALLLPKSWTGSNVGRITSAAARAMKGRALLYWASPQFNVSNDASRWAAAYTANKEAYDECVADGYLLLSNYANIYLGTEDHKEALIVRKYMPSRDLGHNIENVTRPFSESSAGGGSNQPTWNLVKSYLKSDGLPTNSSNTTVAYNDTTFWLNRDPRFNATIAYNGNVWPLSGKPGRKQWTYQGNLDETPNTTTGFYCKRFCNPALTPATVAYNSNSGGGNGIDWIEMRFAEVILNLAECANETDNLTEAKDMVKLIRQRAGIVAGSANYGLDIATDKPSMRTLLLNERQIEFALEGMRYFDLRRTRNLGLITARQSHIATAKPPYYPGTTRSGALPTDIFLDKADAQGVKPRDTITLNNKFIYSKVFNVIPVNMPVSIESGGTINIPDKYYAYALPSSFLQVPAIQQTIGWSGGSFNPFE